VDRVRLIAAATDGKPVPMFKLARQNEKQDDVKADEVLMLYRRAAKLGHRAAARRAATLYASRVDIDRAITFYEMSADEHRKSTMRTLAKLYEKRGLPGDDDKAFARYVSGARAGSRKCMWRCRRAYRSGRSLPVSPDDVAEWETLVSRQRRNTGRITRVLRRVAGLT